MRLSEKKRKFFYAEDDSDTYDASTELWQPYFSLVHDTMLSILEYYLGVTDNTYDRNHRFTILDLGSGTGAEALRVLRAFPNSHLVAVDICSPMHTILRKKIGERFSPEECARRCTLIEGDAFEENWDALLAPARRSVPATFDAVISGYMLHHYTAAEKSVLYKNIYGLLRPGGTFLNADIFTFQSPTVARFADAFCIRWIEKQLTDPDPHLKSAFESMGPNVASLKAKWVQHCREENIPLVFECRFRSPDSESGISASEFEVLRSVGFTEIECPFRYWMAGIVSAMK